MDRLNAEKTILTEAAEVVSEKLVAMGTLTAEKRDEIRIRSLTSSADEDILPLEDNENEEQDTKDEWDISNIE